MVSEPWWPNNYEFESHHPYLFDKNQAQNPDYLVLDFYQTNKNDEI
jgi:hypothetical protein